MVWCLVIFVIFFLITVEEQLQCLCSSTGPILSFPGSKMLKSFGDRSFSIAMPRLWNVLSVELHNITSLSALNGILKHIFSKLPFISLLIT